MNDASTPSRAQHPLVEAFNGAFRRLLGLPEEAVVACTLEIAEEDPSRLRRVHLLVSEIEIGQHRRTSIASAAQAENQLAVDRLELELRNLKTQAGEVEGASAWLTDVLLDADALKRDQAVRVLAASPGGCEVRISLEEMKRMLEKRTGGAARDLDVSVSPEGVVQVSGEAQIFVVRGPFKVTARVLVEPTCLQLVDLAVEGLGETAKAVLLKFLGGDKITMARLTPGTLAGDALRFRRFGADGDCLVLQADLLPGPWLAKGSAPLTSSEG